MTKNGIFRKLVTLIVVGMVFLLPAVSRGAAPAGVLVEKQHNRFSIQAEHAPLLKVLSALDGQIEANLFVADSIAASPVDVHCKNVTLVKALRSILKDFDFIASFSRNTKGEDGIALVKIYPKGDRTGNLVKVAPTNPYRRAVAVGPGSRSLDDGQREGLSGKLSSGTVSGALAARLPPSLLEGNNSPVANGPSMIVKRDLNQQLSLDLQTIAQETWGIQHAGTAVNPDSGGTSSDLTSSAVGSAGSQLNTTELADVVSQKARTETMQADVSAGMDRLHFLQQSDAKSFAVTVAGTP